MKSTKKYRHWIKNELRLWSVAKWTHSASGNSSWVRSESGNKFNFFIARNGWSESGLEPHVRSKILRNKRYQK